jgi:hypothetical protein
LIRTQDAAIVLFAYNRPEKLRQTLESLRAAIGALVAIYPAAVDIPIIVALDGPRSHEGDRRAVHEVEIVVRANLPHAVIQSERVNRGLPSLLLKTLDTLFAESPIKRAICVEDDVQLSRTALLSLLVASEVLGKQGHVIGAAPLHRDGSVEHQALLLDAAAHAATSSFLSGYIERFALDGAEHEGAYGGRDHAAIASWSADIAARAGLSAPGGTSQDRMRELAWRIADVTLAGLPVRTVRHRGLWGQHNTPWYALRTGQLWQRLDQRPWPEIEREVRRAFAQPSVR